MAGVLATLGAASAAFAADPPFLGDWARGDGKTRIRVDACGNEFCGVNTWVKPGVAGESVGDKLTVDVKPAGPSNWSGTAFDLRRKERYTIKIHVADDHMTTDGCVLGGLMCASMGWTRIGATN